MSCPVCLRGRWRPHAMEPTATTKHEADDPAATTQNEPARLRAQQQGYARLPLVYACSGCSSAAQLANQLALRLDHQGLAEMSCIAGVAADVKPLVRTARAGRPMLALDGCPLHCVRHALARQGVAATVHVDFSRHGVAKDLHRLPEPEEAEQAWAWVVLPALLQVHESGQAAARPA
ncbi:MAG: hypothetical protein RJA36_396 [Pseudomonadota bacterium]